MSNLQKAAGEAPGEEIGAAEHAQPLVTVLIPIWRAQQFLGPCLSALGRQTFRHFEVLVVDNGSDGVELENLAGYLAGLPSKPRVLRLPENLGFAGAVAAAWPHCRSRWVALLNDDTVAEPQWLESLLQSARCQPADPTIAAVASKMLSMRDPETIDDAGDTLSWYGSASKRGHGRPATDYSEDSDVFSASGGAGLFLRSAVDEVGGVDPRFESYFEDIDLGLRLRLAGYRCRYSARARVQHLGGGSGLERSRYVRLITRNRLLTFAKSLPAGLLLRHAWQLLWGQWYFLVAYRRPWHSLRGGLDFLRAIGDLVESRQAFRPLRRLDSRQIEALLEQSHAEPPLNTLLWRKLRGEPIRGESAEPAPRP